MATVSVVPDLIDALISAYRERRADVLVVDGSDPVGDDADLVLYVGMADPRSTAADNAAGSLTQEWPNATAQTRRETGTITCAAMAFDGSEVMKAARDAVFSIFSDVQLMMWADPRLGVAGVVKTSVGNVSLDQAMTTRGAFATLLFSIDFESRLERAAA